MSMDVDAADGDEMPEAREASDGDKRAIADADRAGQLAISGDTKTPRALRTSEPPTGTARMLHFPTHVPYRDKCTFCVASRARGFPHRRVVVNKTADTLSMFQAHYTLIGKEGGYEDLTKEILRHFESHGFLIQ